MQPGLARKRIRPRPKRTGVFHHGDLREALVLAAMRAVEQHGHADMSLRPIADQLGVTQPAVYRHFKNRGALLGEVATRCWQQLQAVLVAAVKSERDPTRAARAS